MSAPLAVGRRSSRLESGRDLCEQLGALDSTLYAASRFLEKLSGGRAGLIKYRVVAQPVPRIARGTLRADPNAPVEFAAPDSPLAKHFPRLPEVIRQRYASGAVCLAAEVRGRFAGFLSPQRSSYEKDEVRCRYGLDGPGRGVWDLDVCVEPPYRLRRTMARLWQAAGEHLTSRGVQWSFSRISAINAASLGAHARLGLVKCRTVTFLLVGPLQLALLPQFPFVHASVRDCQRPTIRLRSPRGDATSSAHRLLPRA